MGTEIDKQITYITILKYAEEIKKIIKDNPDSYIQKVVTLLLSFIKSEDFIPFMLINRENFFFNIFIICELGKEKDKYIFIKILFPLLEELKKSKFKSQIWELNHIEQEDQKSILTLYYNSNKNKINEKLNMCANKGKNPFEVLKNLIKNKSGMFGNYLSRMINVLFANEEIIKNNIKAQNIIDEAFTFFKPYFYDLKKFKNYNISKLVEYLMELHSSIVSIKEIYNITMFAILKAINEDRIKSKFDIYEKEINFLINIVNLKDNYIWFLLEESGKLLAKVSGQIKIKEERVGINIFTIIKNKNKNKIINGYICKSFFINYDIIMIEIDLYYYKVNKINIETIKSEIEKEIKRIKESNKNYYNLNSYIHLDNTIILYPQSYDLFLQYLLEINIISNNLVPEEYHSLIEFSLKRNLTMITPQQNENMNNQENINNNNDKICIDRVNNQFPQIEGENNDKNDNEKQLIENNQKIKDIQKNANDSLQVNQLKEELEKEKLKNKDLSVKIKELENNLFEKNNKNQNLELKIKELNIEIELLKEKYNKLKILQEIGGQTPMDNSEIKDSLYESVFEKEKEIKELKLQLSRYPLLLNDGDKLMSLIFTSADQVIHHSIICKNNELFINVENRLYDEGFSEYKESENFFTFNGLKINKNKTIEENNIKNSDVIILNIIDDDD